MDVVSIETNLVCCDTNILLDSPQIIENYNVVLLSHVLRELDKHKLSKDEALAYRARLTIRYLKENINKVKFDINDYKAIDGFDDVYVDNKIITACIENNYSLLTKDLLLEQKALAYKVNVIEYKNDFSDDYKGYKEFIWTEEEIANFYENREVNKYNVLVNEYLIIKNTENEFIECVKWNGELFELVNPRGFTTNLFGKFKPYDYYQKALLDSLINNQMTMIKGKAGTGKSLIALNYSINMLEKNKYDKLICFVNPMASKNSAKLGFYPGTRFEKLMDSAIGSMLSSKLGDKSEVENMVNNGKLILLPFSDIRGFDTTGMNAIVYIIEAQNLDIDLMKLAIQRCGEDTKLIIDGDYNTQVDHYSYEGNNNGMRRVSEVFRGQEFYGEVELQKIYRSKMASIADLL